MKILGISAYYHDSAAALIEHDRIIAAAQEERFTRKKNDPAFPVQAIKYCLSEAGRRLSELDAIVFYDKPFLKFERLLETYISNAPSGIRSFIAAMPVWLKEKLFLKAALKKACKEIDEAVNWKKTELLFSSHHLSHAASALYPSGFSRAAIVCIDGVGEWATATIARGNGSELEVIQEMHFPDSVGLLYSAFTYYLGFAVNEGEYKVMGLAPYAKDHAELVSSYRTKINQHIVTVFDDGSLKLNQHYFRYATSLRMVNEKAFTRLFGFKRRLPPDKITINHCCLALALQQVLEDILLKMVTHAKQLTGETHLCLAGGVALNCVANGLVREQQLFDDIFIQPAAGDAGGALGAALAAYHLHYKNDRQVSGFGMQEAYLGPSFGEAEIEKTLAETGLSFKKYNEDQLTEYVSEALQGGKVIGWFQGRMEFGPRALGNRSILASAARADMQSTLNLKVKKRESFRPFAPIMLEEEFRKLFGMHYTSPYMLFVHKILPTFRKQVPAFNGNLFETINQQRSVLPAITHIDYSSRIQTVNKQTHPRLHRLLTLMKEKTGYGVLINTSFNIKDEPIVCTPADAVSCFKLTGIDILVLENYVATK